MTETLIRRREPVVLADDFDALVTWYRDALGLAVVQRIEEPFHYAILEGAPDSRTGSGFRVGIAAAAEMGVSARTGAPGTVALQCEVDDLPAWFEALRTRGVEITGGPSHDAAGGFWFGSLADGEGNAIWVVDANCP